VAKRSLLAHGADLIRHVVPQVIRPIRSLWHEVIGFLSRKLQSAELVDKTIKLH